MPRLVAPHLPADALSRIAQPELHGAGVVLRPWQDDDAGFAREAFDAPDIQRWHLTRMDDVEEARRWTRAWAGRWAAGTGAGWAVCLAGEEQTQPGQRSSSHRGAGAAAVGYVALRAVHLLEGSAEVSYWVTPAARGRGVAVRAAQTVARWALGDLGLHRVWLMHSTANPASCAVAERAGFAPEGVLRERLRHADGWHDMHVHGRLGT